MYEHPHPFAPVANHLNVNQDQKRVEDPMTLHRRALRFFSPARPAIVFFFLFLVILFPPPVCGQSIGILTEGNVPWRIYADRISYDRSGNEFSASGNVEIIQGDKRLRADQVRFNKNLNTALASGNVHFTSAGDSLVGDRLTIDLGSGTGTLYKGMIFIEKSNFFIKGDLIEKTGESTYHIRKAGLTACEQKTPDWRITGSDLNVNVEGYGTVWNPTFWVKKVPVFYVPFFIFPVRNERETGLLLPSGGYSDRLGFFYEQPFFWAISDNTDATFYYEHLQFRGEKPGVEYRYVLSEESKGTFFIEGFNDREVDDGTGETSEKWGYTDDAYLRPNSDRYWLRMKADQELPGEVKSKLDLDIVSDQDYLQDFDGGYLGFDATENYFESEFGRDLDEKEDPVRTNRLNFNRNWSASSFNTDFVWYDNVIKRRQSDEDDTLQRLPTVSYSALKQPVYSNRVFSALNTEYDHFYRMDGQTGHRTDIYPKIFLPMHMKNYFTFEPSAGFRQTAWYTDDEGDDSPSRDPYAHRELYDVGAALSTDVNRVFPVSVFGLQKIKHTIVPMLEYHYLPETDQAKYPDFDELDRIEGENEIALSMTHFFTSKRVVHRPGGGSPETIYNMFGRFMIEQPYNLDPEKNSMDGTSLSESEDFGLTPETFEEGTPWEPLYMELDFTPMNLITLHGDTQYSHHSGAIVTGNLGVITRDPRGDEFRVDYRYNRDINKSIFLETLVPITYWLSIYGDYERNLMDNKDIGLQIGTLYRSGCWSVDTSYRKEGNDKRYAVLFNLYGLGEIGNRR